MKTFQRNFLKALLLWTLTLCFHSQACATAGFAEWDTKTEGGYTIGCSDRGYKCVYILDPNEHRVIDGIYDYVVYEGVIAGRLRKGGFFILDEAMSSLSNYQNLRAMNEALVSRHSRRQGYYTMIALMSGIYLLLPALALVVAVYLVKRGSLQDSVATVLNSNWAALMVSMGGVWLLAYFVHPFADSNKFIEPSDPLINSAAVGLISAICIAIRTLVRELISAFKSPLMRRISVFSSMGITILMFAMFHFLAVTYVISANPHWHTIDDAAIAEE